MIPSVLSTQLRRGVEDFLRTTFPISTPYFSGLFDGLFQGGEGIFRGPYVSAPLPFLQPSGKTDHFPEIPMAFAPYAHQAAAFERLGGPGARSTIIATGAGSGKTESFLYPILDHCRSHRGEPGIKAIIIYPMNALATDQARRIALTIWDNPNLKSFVTAGLYVGGDEVKTHTVMGRDHLITDREIMRKAPPDILLTNYKMLDYLLIRPGDLNLWSQNRPTTLRYLVVDEMHTFDGAQGSDLACLIRRLKQRLDTPAGHLCAVASSATLGGESGSESLLGFASELFGETFERDSIITESRMSVGEFLAESLTSELPTPSPSVTERLDAEEYESWEAYIAAQYGLWFQARCDRGDVARGEWRVELGERLKTHRFFQNLIKVLKGRPLPYAAVIAGLSAVDKTFSDGDTLYQERTLNSMIALMSTARITITSKDGGAIQRPFLDVRLQLWLRELRRIVAPVEPSPRIRFNDDLPDVEQERHLPILHCRDCGSVGWAGTHRVTATRIDNDLQRFYRAFFSQDPSVTMIFPDTDPSANDGLAGERHRFCGDCLELAPHDAETCPSCGGERLVPVFVPESIRESTGRRSFDQTCPYCSSPEGLTVVGSRAASLTSVMITQLFSSNFNDDKKLLAFSDSVQDAAHRAGFFNARTYRFNLRGALQRFVLDGGAGLTLDQISSAFSTHWSKELGAERFVGTFLPNDMAWLEDYQTLLQTNALPAESGLARMVEKRIAWEIYSEYTFRARIGRTLEKTGSSIACIDQTMLEGVINELDQPLRNEIGELMEVDRGEVRRFLAGLLIHLKNNGAVVTGDLTNYVNDFGNIYLLNRIHHLPRFGGRSRGPVFLTTKSSSRFEPLLAGRSARRTWVEAWCLKSFAPYGPIDYRLRDLLELSLGALTSAGVLGEMEVKGERVWGIRPEALRVSSSVRHLRCEVCEDSLSVAAEELERFAGASCLRFRCAGHYRAVDGEGERDGYYKRLYQSGDIVRIVANEHTGLLERSVREEVEQDFMRGEHRPWDPNVLSCTPTLELGIDIGDLSSVILCSVPPTQASYIQRIGRAGRRDGNALNVTVANGRPHDLYFFARPEEMIAGHVETPSMFLSAPAVLERQFTAFCFDQWVRSGKAKNAIPRSLGKVLDNLQSPDPSLFPLNFLTFIGGEQTLLFDQFVAMFGVTLTTEAIDRLRDFVEGDEESAGSLRYRIADRLNGVRKEQESLRKKIRGLQERIKKKMGDPAKGKDFNEEIDELKHERVALDRIVSRIREKSPYNFFTDEGLIPNYAFPEAGVTLRSIIFRKKGEGQRNDKPYESIVYEYERPAVSAIHELAPDNTFYAEGRRVTIDQINLEVSETEEWRFCANCSHMERVDGSAGHAACPRCGSPQFSNVGQKQRMVRMRQVIATTSDRESRISDDAEERTPAFFNKRMMVDAPEQYITDAFQSPDESFPFGFEFLSRATFREVNLGPQNNAGERMHIAGEDVIKTGFKVCTGCGKVQPHRNSDKIKHAPWCRARDGGAKENLEEFLFLYREFSSEAIRILMPVGSQEASAERLHSFVAALQLGLRKHFGRVDHLATTIQDEPVPNLNVRKRFLVLYDTVPGGTGYLKQLMRDAEPMMQVFEKGLEVLTTCTCREDDSKDGCYRCLYAYRNSRDLPAISRRLAIEMLQSLLDNRTAMERVSSLHDIDVSSIEESELEVLFIEALRRANRVDRPIIVRKDEVNGKPGRYLKVGNGSYVIEPQVELGPNEGISVPSRADFVIRPYKANDPMRPIAIFTDGFEYHRDRIGHDLAQRMAIVRSGRYLVWSLTWKDVVSGKKSNVPHYQKWLPRDRQMFNKVASAIDGERQLPGAIDQSPFDLLLRYLEKPDDATWELHAMGLAMEMISSTAETSEHDPRTWLRNHIPGGGGHSFDDGWLWRGIGMESDAAPVRILCGVEKARANDRSPDAVRVVASIRDDGDARKHEDFATTWNGFLRLYDLMQFLPDAIFVSSTGIEGGAYEFMTTPVTPAETPTHVPPAESEWGEAMELVEATYRGLLERLQTIGMTPPIAGYELTDETGMVLAEAELAWPDLAIALLRDDQLDYGATFVAHGWKSHSINDVPDDPRIDQTRSSTR